MSDYRTGDALLDAYLYAGGGGGPFPSRAVVVIRCQQHGTNLAGFYDTELGPLVALGDTFDGDAPERLTRKRKLPAGWNLDLRLLDDLDDGDRLGVWCHAGGRITVDVGTIRDAWANRGAQHTIRVQHLAD